MNQHDETRKMLDLIRESKRVKRNKSIITEQTAVKGDIDLAQDDLSAYNEEEKNFRGNVTPRTKFNRFKLYPESQNVEFSGVFTDSRIEWFYSLDDTQGVYITADLLQLNEQTLKQIQKLVAYYETWSNEWGNKIAEEYQNEVTDELNAEEGPEDLEDIENEEGEFEV